MTKTVRVAAHLFMIPWYAIFVFWILMLIQWPEIFRFLGLIGYVGLLCFYDLFAVQWWGQIFLFGAIPIAIYLFISMPFSKKKVVAILVYSGGIIFNIIFTTPYLMNGGVPFEGI